MKKFRKLTSLLLAVMLVVSMATVSVVSTSAVIEDGGSEYDYEVYNGTAEITWYTGKDTELVVPSEIDGYMVTSIEWGAFKDCKSLKSITIPDSVKFIGYEAFYGCTNLTEIIMSNGVKTIDEYAFYYCTSLKSVTIPSSVTSIGFGAFGYLNIDEYQEIYKKIGGFTIYGHGGTAAQKYAKNYNFKFIDLDKEDCPEYSYNILDDGTAEITEYTGRDTNLVIPDEIDGHKVTSISHCDFYCGSPKTITLPDSVTTIGDYAFTRLGGLKSITIPDSVTFIGESAFQYCGKLESIILPDSITFIGDYAFYGCSSLISITIPNGVTSISDHAFEQCESLSDISIPNSVTSISSYAYKQCKSLTDISIPNSVTSIECGAFIYCENLVNVVIPDSVTSIEDGAFAYCYNLKSLTIPSSVVNMGKKVFGGYGDYNFDLKIYGYTGTAAEECANYNDIEFIALDIEEKSEYFYNVLDDGTAEITGYSGEDTDLLIPSEIKGNKVTGIGASAFSNCTSVKSITLPDGVTSIGDYAFAGCTGLTSITIPDSVTNIGEYSFGYNYKNKIDGFKIYGYRGTAAEEYANENRFVFIDLDKKEIIGDVNGDGKLSVADATIIQKYLADLIDLTAEQLYVADVNGNGVVNVFDATAIQSLLVS